MAQILLSSTCKASVGERQRDRQIRGSGLQEFLQKNKGFRASGGYLQKNKGFRASGGYLQKNKGFRASGVPPEE
jgi:hypothetical protein